MVLSSYANVYSIPDYSDWSNGTYSGTNKSSGINITANMLHVELSEILINPGFETCTANEPSNWSTSNTSYTRCGTDAKYSGTYGAAVSDAQYIYQSISATSGTSYTFSVRTRKVVSSYGVMLIGTTIGGSEIAAVSNTSTNWTLLSYTYVSPSNQTIYMSLKGDSTVTGDEHYFDGASIVQNTSIWTSPDVDLGYSTSISAVKWYGDETATAYWDTNTSGAKQIEIKCATTQAGLTSASYVAVSYNTDPGCDTIQWVKIKVTGQLTTTQDSLKRPHLWGIDVIYSDPPDWTGRTCTSKKQLHVDNNDESVLASGWVVGVLPGLFDISIATPSQISVARYTGTWTELDRTIRGKTIQFKTQANIAAWSTDTSYWLYYGCTTGSPLSAIGNIYAFSDNFDDNLFSDSNWIRKALDLQYGDEFNDGTLDTNLSVYTVGGGSVTEITGETENFTSSIPSTFTSVVAGGQTAAATGGVARLTIPATTESIDDAGIIYRNEQSYRRYFFEPVTVSVKGYINDMGDGSTVYFLGMWEGAPAISTTANFNIKNILSVGVVRSGTTYKWEIKYKSAQSGSYGYWNGTEWLSNASGTTYGTVSTATWYKVKLIFDEYTVKVRLEDNVGALIEETDPIGIFWLGAADWANNQLYYWWGEPLNDAGWAKLDSDDFDINWGQMKITESAEADVATVTYKTSDGSGRWTDMIANVRVNAISTYDNPTYGGFMTVLGLYEATGSQISPGCTSGANERFAIRHHRSGANYYTRIIYFDTACTQYFWNGSSWTTTASSVSSGVVPERHFGYRIECTNADGCRGIVTGADGTWSSVGVTTFVPWSTMQNDAGIADANNWKVGTGENHASLFYGTMYVDHFRVYKTVTTGAVEQNQRIELTATGKYGASWVQRATGSSTARRLYAKLTTGAASNQKYRIGLAWDNKHTDTHVRWVAWADFTTGSDKVVMGKKIGATEGSYLHDGVAAMTEALAISTAYEIEFWHKNTTVYVKVYKTSDNSLVFSQPFANGDYAYVGNDSLTIYPTIMVWNDNNALSSVAYFDDYGEATMLLPAAMVNPFTRTNRVGVRHSIDDAGRIWYARDTRIFYSNDGMMENDVQVFDFGDAATFNNPKHVHWIWISKDYGAGQYLMIGTREGDGKFYISKNCNLDPTSDLCDTTAEWTEFNYNTITAGITGCSPRPLDVQGGTYVEALLVACYGYPSDTKEHVLRSTNWRDNATPTWTHSLLSNVTGVMHTHQIEEHRNTHVLYTSSHIPRSYKSTDGGQNWTTVFDKLLLFRGSSISTSTALIIIADSEQWNIINTSISGTGTEERDNMRNRYGIICYYCNIDLPRFTNTWDENSSKIYSIGMVWPGNPGSPDSVSGLVSSDNNGTSWDKVYDFSKGYDTGLGTVKRALGWVSVNKSSLYEVYFESGIHNVLNDVNQFMYGTKKSNLTLKMARTTPIKYYWERMEKWNDSFFGN